jgi:hypothetical protein
LIGLPARTVDDIPFPEPGYRPTRIKRVPYRAGYTPNPPGTRCRLKRASESRYTYVLKGCRP